MSKRDPILTPELVKILKIFFGSSLILVLFFSFFDDYRANYSGEDRTFRVADSNRLYFQNVRSIYYDREVRQDAGMVLYRHRKRLRSDSIPTLDLVIILNPVKDDAYIYFELRNADWPIQIRVDSLAVKKSFDFANGNNQGHFQLFEKLVPLVEENAEFELVLGEKTFPLWAGEKEKESLRAIAEDYLRLLSLTN